MRVNLNLLRKDLNGDCEMIGAIKRLNLDEEYHTPEGCFIIEVSNSPDDPEASVARARVAPGVTTRWHRLKATTERYVILEGIGRVEIGNIPPQEVSSGDVVLIPPLYSQRITNIGPNDLIFLAICTPPFKNEVYEDIDDVLSSEMPVKSPGQ
jgi:mannose-6-phosphate isomerase-like protein (cupin superfamily)